MVKGMRDSLVGLLEGKEVDEKEIVEESVDEEINRIEESIIGDNTIRRAVFQMFLLAYSASAAEHFLGEEDEKNDEVEN